MTNDDLCPECAHPLSEHPDGLACCPFCGNSPLILEYELDAIMVHCDCGATTGLWDSEKDAISDWNTRAHPSPWLNAPIPEYGCVQQLVIMEDGSWGIQYIEEYDKGVTKFCFTGVNGGPARTERRTMINGKLVYEEEK